jgi:hypothetical protein
VATVRVTVVSLAGAKGHVHGHLTAMLAQRSPHGDERSPKPLDKPQRWVHQLGPVLSAAALTV